MNEKAFHAMSYGVYIVTSWDNGRPVGCTANCAAQITASPATVMVSVNKDNYTNKCIADCGHFALSILSENSSPEIIGRFGFQSSRDHDKFAETAYAVKNSRPSFPTVARISAAKSSIRWILPRIRSFWAR